MSIPIVILDHTFSCPQPFTAGHPCSAGEAAALNAAFAAALRRSFTKQIAPRLASIQRAHGPESTWNTTEILALREEFAHHASTFVLGAGTPRRTFHDPVARTAHHIAVDLVREKLRERGIHQDKLPSEIFNKHVETVAKRPVVLAEAKRRVDAAKNIIEDTLFDNPTSWPRS